MKHPLSDRIFTLGMKQRVALDGFRKAVDDALQLLIKEPIPTFAALVRFGEACERLKWRASDLDKAVRDESVDLWAIAQEVEKALTIPTLTQATDPPPNA